MLNPEQKNAFKAISKFLGQAGPDTFVLKGYAGTGKTFLMQHLAKWLKTQDRDYCLLASTGRASTVLRGKTGLAARTVHGELYQFSKVEGDHDDLPEDAPDEKYGQMRLQFLLRQPDEEKRIYIVDEASMLSSEPSDDSLAAFGSGILLHDFFDAVGSNKIIFVGDPCQLPPVGQANSPALDMNWLSDHGRTAMTLTLETIERTDAGNDLLLLAGAIRNMVDHDFPPKWPKLPAGKRNNVKLHDSAEELFKAYLKRYKKSGTNGTLAIARSNAMVQQINREFRKELYGETMPLQLNDVLLVNRNNYQVPLTNGDFVTVMHIGEPAMQAGLYFQHVKVIAAASGEEYELLLSLDILYGQTGQFSREQSKTLMVDFSRRVKKQQMKSNSASYKEAMKKDPYLNCLQATYGYAVTCHKAQGGEWDDIFLFLDSRMYGMPPNELFRWWYTAVTRAKKELNLENAWWIA